MLNVLHNLIQGHDILQLQQACLKTKVVYELIFAGSIEDHTFKTLFVGEMSDGKWFGKMTFYDK